MYCKFIDGKQRAATDKLRGHLMEHNDRLMECQFSGRVEDSATL